MAAAWSWFSPHAWGCPEKRGARAIQARVLPTRVGMSRSRPSRAAGPRGSPHTRGDVPGVLIGEAKEALFSPHAWGCPGPRLGLVFRPAVLPTRVGMSRFKVAAGQLLLCSPHTRGDVPESPSQCWNVGRFSPHAWGCPSERGCRRPTCCVLPTRVGMSRCWRQTPAPPVGSPHTRGDVPRFWQWRQLGAQFSPHAWGCPEDQVRPAPNDLVLPTRVGMSQSTRSSSARSRCSPHTRGDVPLIGRKVDRLAMFSPQGWGCPDDRHVLHFEMPVLPTRVRMSRCSPAWTPAT